MAVWFRMFCVLSVLVQVGCQCAVKNCKKCCCSLVGSIVQYRLPRVSRSSCLNPREVNTGIVFQFRVVARV